jgi:hypothetical protein
MKMSDPKFKVLPHREDPEYTICWQYVNAEVLCARIFNE